MLWALSLLNSVYYVCVWSVCSSCRFCCSGLACSPLHIVLHDFSVGMANLLCSAPSELIQDPSSHMTLCALGTYDPNATVGTHRMSFTVCVCVCTQSPHSSILHTTFRTVEAMCLPGEKDEWPPWVNGWWFYLGLQMRQELLPSPPHTHAHTYMSACVFWRLLYHHDGHWCLDCCQW